MTSLRFIFRLLLALLLSAATLALLSLAAFFAGAYFFGLAGHPAAPDVPSAAYLAYAIVAPLACIGSSVWVVFRRTPRGKRQ